MAFCYITSKMAEPKSNYVKGVDRLFANGRIKTYPKNQLIHYQDDPLTSVYLVTDGYVKAYTILDSGDTRTLLLLSQGDIFPLAFAASMDWENYKVRYFYQTLTDVKVLVLEAGDFKEGLEKNVSTMRTYMTYLAASNEAIMNQLEVMKEKKAIDKISLLLPYLADKAGKEIKPGVYELQLKLSHQELADLSGVTRETTTTLIKELEKAGVIDQSNSRWLINTKKLESTISE